MIVNLCSGASANVEGITANLASLKLGLHSRDGAPQLMKLLDENLQWSDTALEVSIISDINLFNIKFKICKIY